MPLTSKVIYQGNLRNQAEHLKSGQVILNDAPLDNNGKGEAFSPTDMVATALATCALTVMGIRAKQEGFDLEETSASVVKEMASDPRRIGTIAISISIKANCSEKMQKILEGVGRNCPVSKSLSSDLKQEFEFNWTGA
ncbi:MAG: OsmC family protein [Bacteroidetes bacterium]|nr:OsmC family protein [Bacteroidota bacterium]